VALTLVFTALAFYIVSRSEDRLKGLGIAIALWLLFAVLYDGLVLLFLSIFSSHSIERPVLGLMLLNPIDLARVALLLQFDVSALLGYTGAVLRKFFETTTGVLVTATALIVWIAGPVVLGLKAFQKKDF
jgi:Cu-processing system permease protein